MTKHPIQPIIIDEHGVHRFKENKIISYLFETGNIDLNALALVKFPNDDREQLAQLLGYSVSGFSSLSYASNETVNEAFKRSEKLVDV